MELAEGNRGGASPVSPRGRGGIGLMLSNFSFIRSHSISALPKWAFAVCACSFFLVRERTNQENVPKGSALWIRVVRGLAHISPRPEQKTCFILAVRSCYRAFFHGCAEVARVAFAASGNPKISLLRRHIDVPLPFGKRGLSRTPPFSLCEGLASLLWALLRSPNFVLRSSKIFE